MLGFHGSLAFYLRVRLSTVPYYHEGNENKNSIIENIHKRVVKIAQDYCCPRYCTHLSSRIYLPCIVGNLSMYALLFSTRGLLLTLLCTQYRVCESQTAIFDRPSTVAKASGKCQDSRNLQILMLSRYYLAAIDAFSTSVEEELLENIDLPQSYPSLGGCVVRKDMIARGRLPASDYLSPRITCSLRQCLSKTTKLYQVFSHACSSLRRDRR